MGVCRETISPNIPPSLFPAPQLTKCKHLLFYAETTALSDRVCLQNSLGGGGYDHLADSLCTKHPMPINLQIAGRKAMKINDNGQYFDFIVGTLSYVTYVMS